MVLYSSDNDYNPASEAGIRWNDQAVKVPEFTTDQIIISEKDDQWPDLI